MKKITSAADLGGGPVTKADLRTVFNDEIWDALEAIPAGYGIPLIISGCVISANGGGFDITAGIVYIDGQFLRVSAATGQTFSKFICIAAVSNDTRTFADSTSHVLYETYSAQLAGAAPGAGQFITISSLTSAEPNRLSNRVNIINTLVSTLTYSPLSAAQGKVLNDLITVINSTLPTKVNQSDIGNLLMKTVTIGDWNMDTTATLNVPHGLSDHKKIRSLRAIVRDDTNTNIFELDGSGGAGAPVGGFDRIPADATNLKLWRLNAGYYDDPAFDATSFNRGWVYIVYEP